MSYSTITTQDDIDEINWQLDRIIRNENDSGELKKAAKTAKKTIALAWKKIVMLEKCCCNCDNPFRMHGMIYDRHCAKPHWRRDSFVKKDSKEVSCWRHPDAIDHAYQSENGMKTVCENWKSLKSVTKAKLNIKKNSRSSR